MSRQYTGYDRTAAGKRAGLENLIHTIEFLSGGGLWNNGSLVVRPMRGKPNMSVHATGRATDLSWRKMPNLNRNGYGSYEKAVEWMEFLAQNAEVLDIEAIFDYFPKPFGRGWRCDRESWTVYTKRAFGGAPGGDWIHIEIGNKYADDPTFYERKISELFTGLKAGDKITPATSVQAEPPAAAAAFMVRLPYPGVSLRRGSQGHSVRAVQARVDALVDGNFGPKTEAAVRRWQAANPAAGPADGWVGPKTWKAMFG